MSESLIEAVIVSDEESLSLQDFARACRAQDALIQAMVDHAILEPRGQSFEEWQFPTYLLVRSRRALRLHRDLQIDWSGVALALDLLDEIEQLQQRLQHYPQS